jgi:hypothetical protein
MKFSIQSLLLMVTIFAITLGWWIDHTRLQNTNARLNAENCELIGRVMPSSGFAHLSGLATRKRPYSHSSPEDRKKLLFLLDNLLTHGKDSNQPLMMKEIQSETRRSARER